MPRATAEAEAAATTPRRRGGRTGVEFIRMLAGGDGDGDGDDAPADDARPWWRRPPPVWPPRIDEPQLVLGDVTVAYAAAFACLNVLTTGRALDWYTEGSAMATSWLVAAAVPNAWDPTAVLPSLGLRNALSCVARASVDLASTRVLLALAGAVLARQAVDVKLLLLEVTLETAVLALWRAWYMTTSTDER